MTHTDIRSALAELSAIASDLERIYLENGGEVTEETASLEDRISVIRELLTTEGVDDLGRWLSAKQDEIVRWKNEKALANARMLAAQKSEAYIKALIAGVLRATGTEKVKGAYYSFAQGDSKKSEVLTDVLDADYLEAATEAARNAGLPPFVDVCLKARVSDIQAYADANDGEGLEYVCTTVEPAVKFTKPRKVKEETA